jgi:hypothetical protein
MLTLAMPAPGQAADPPAKRPGNPPAASATEGSPDRESKPRPIPFHGTIASVDPRARTFTIGRRTFQVTPATRIEKGGQTVKLDSAKVGERASGSYLKQEGGQLVTRSLYLGPRPGSASGTANSKSAADRRATE